MATTTNFGWATPDDTDYVKDGASAMRTLGSAIDASLADLRGGADTYILAKNSAADMDFEWIPNALAASPAGINKILNGDFGIWQRGTTFSAKNAHVADRWINFADGSGDTFAISRQAFTPGTAPVAGYEGQYFLRYNVSVAGTGNTYRYLDQRIENAQTFAGQTVTLSFWAKADATRTMSSGFTQFFGAGGSAEVGITGASYTVTTSWQRFTTTVSIPSIAGKTIGTGSFFYVRFGIPQNATFTIDLWGVQLEAGSVATPFTTATGNPASELAACQRYYWRTSGGGTYMVSGMGTAASTTRADISIPLPVQMRTWPTAIEYGNQQVSRDFGSAGIAPTSITISSNQGTLTMPLVFATVASGLTAGTVYRLTNDGAGTGYIGFSAEL